MIGYLARRLLPTIPTLFIMLTAIFVLVRLASSLPYRLSAMRRSQ